MVERYAAQPHMDDSLSSQMSAYVADVWKRPEEHLVEIGLAGVATAAVLMPVARSGLRLLSEKGAPASGEAAMSQGNLKNAVASVRDLSYEVDSGFSKLIGRTGPNGERVLRTADNNAFLLRPLNGTSNESVFAHELVLPKKGNQFTARFFTDSQHTHNWSSLETPAWPNGKNGIWSNLRDAGVSLRPNQTPLKLEFTNDMSRLEIASISGERFGVGVDAALEGKVKTVGQSAMSNRLSSLGIEGPNAVKNGNGLISARDPEWTISRSHVQGYPEVKPGETLRIYYEPQATIRPSLSPDVRFMTKTEGLVRQV